MYSSTFKKFKPFKKDEPQTRERGCDACSHKQPPTTRSPAHKPSANKPHGPLTTLPPTDGAPPWFLRLLV